MKQTINIAIPTTLRDAIAERARRAGRTQDELADTLLLVQLNAAPSAQILRNPRVTALGTAHATLNIGRSTNDRVAALAAMLSAEVRRTMPKGRLIQALLWSALDSFSDDERQDSTPPVAPRPTFTARVPQALNTALLLRAVGYSMTRETLIDDLLAQGFATFAEDTAPFDLLLQQPHAVTTTAGATIHVPHQYDTPLRALAATHFRRVKTHALHALLWMMLDRTQPASPDQAVFISDVLHTQIVQALHHTRSKAQHLPSVRAFVEQAIEHELQRTL